MPSRAVCGSIGIVMLAGAALGDVPTFYRPWMPDIDQYRFLGGGTLGLPNDGRMYCVPTATLNLMAYMDRHGYPAMLDLAENESFYTTNAYIEIGTDLIFMGLLMNTHPVNGTGGAEWIEGTRGWIDQRYDLWQFAVVYKGSSQFDPVGPEDFAAYNAMGCVTTMGIGWYEYLGNSTYRRSGGHVVTAVGVSDPPDGPPVIHWRDPADTNADWYAQDLFRTATSPAQLEVHFFRTSEGDDIPCLRNRLTAYSGHAFLESLVAVFPLFGMTSTPDYTQLVLRYPLGIIGDLRPKTTTINLPPGRLLKSVLCNVMGPSLTLLRPGGAGGPHSIYLLDPITNRLEHAVDVVDPGPWDICRKGCLWFTDGRMLNKGVITDDSGIEVDANLLLPATPQALTTLDGLDLIAVLCDGSVRVYDEALDLVDAEPLPTQVALNGPVVMSGDPSDPARMLITSFNSPAIYMLHWDAMARRWTVEGSIPVPTGAHPTDLEVGDDGHVFFISGGRVFERFRTAAGGWATPRVPLFSPTETFGDSFDIPFSRSSEGVDGPWPNDINVEPPGSPDGFVSCGPDLTTSSDPADASYGVPDGVLDASDFFYFLDRFVAADFITCDISGSSDPLSPVYGVPDSELDAGDFFYYLDLFTGGCP